MTGRSEADDRAGTTCPGFFVYYDTDMHIEAIVIRKRPVREHDQFVILYSRELGKVGALAKGSLRGHSKQAHAIDEGSMVRCELVEGKSAPIMTGAQSVRSLSGAKRSAITWAATQFFLQAVDTVVFDAQPDEVLWVCLNRVLSDLDVAASDDLLDVYRGGQRALLSALGYGVPPEHPGNRWTRCGLDEQFEAVAQRRLSSIDLLYDVAAMSRS